MPTERGEIQSTFVVSGKRINYLLKLHTRTVPRLRGFLRANVCVRPGSSKLPTRGDPLGHSFRSRTRPNAGPSYQATTAKDFRSSVLRMVAYAIRDGRVRRGINTSLNELSDEISQLKRLK